MRLDNLFLLVFLAMLTGGLAGSIGFYYGMEYQRIMRAEYYHATYANFVDKDENPSFYRQAKIVKIGFW